MDDFDKALYEEFGLEPETETPSEAPAAKEGEEGDKQETVKTPQAEDAAQVPEKADKPETEPAKPAEGAAEGADGKQPNAPEAPKEGDEADKKDEPKFATKEDVMDAMREYNRQTTERVNNVSKARDEIINVLHPEGIDTNIYDSNGQIVKTAQDIVDRGLINERTNEPFTYEEAASFMLQAQQQMAKNVDELNRWADNVAEQNISLKEGSDRVMTQWGDVLEAMPNLAKQLAERYITTQLQFDKTGSYITRMSMTPEDFYNLALSPYRQLGDELARKQVAEEQQQREQQEAEQNERMGIPPQRGNSAMKSNTGDKMLDALVDELNKD